MRTLDEARAALQMSQEDIDFIVSHILEVTYPVAIVAYGSRARGEAREDSDYDILALSDLDGKELKRASIKAGSNLWDFDYALDFLILNRGEFSEGLHRGNRFAAEVDRDGVVLYGEL